MATPQTFTMASPSAGLAEPEKFPAATSAGGGCISPGPHPSGSSRYSVEPWNDDPPRRQARIARHPTGVLALVRRGDALWQLRERGLRPPRAYDLPDLRRRVLSLARPASGSRRVGRAALALLPQLAVVSSSFFGPMRDAAVVAMPALRNPSIHGSGSVFCCPESIDHRGQRTYGLPGTGASDCPLGTASRSLRSAAGQLGTAICWSFTRVPLVCGASECYLLPACWPSTGRSGTYLA
jgi:hypothetical protein